VGRRKNSAGPTSRNGGQLLDELQPHVGHGPFDPTEIGPATSASWASARDQLRYKDSIFDQPKVGGGYRPNIRSAIY
jgi:hypothetical protein